ncbi:MAG: HEAT repeat domain-containing protein [Lachnospiraceae bacterium]|nr:HEAT repeat domain-containing protein [Lachnospiraceae bacterium]
MSNETEVFSKKNIEENQLKDHQSENPEQTYEELEKENFPDGKRIKFIAELGASSNIEGHFQLICRSWKEEKNLRLESSFDRHGEEGLRFLLERLKKTEITDALLQREEASEELIEAVFTAYLLAEILSQGRHRSYYPSYCEKLLPFLLRFSETEEDFLREKCLIALGWVAGEREIPFLTRKMLEDRDALCRAWAASSLMQMSFHRVNGAILQEETKKDFAKAIEEEKDLQASGIMIEAAQTLFSKKWLSASALEAEDEAQIEKARRSAVRFLLK